MPSTPHCADRARRVMLGASLGWAALAGMPGCALPEVGAPAWAARLQGDTVALLGEVHDNPAHHRLRAAALRRACAAGWRPAVVMEQFDLERQGDIERSRYERPRDVQHLVAQAGNSPGWAWDDYAALLAVVMEFELPLWAGNLSRAQATRIMREGYEAVLGAGRVAAWGLERAPDAAWQAAQEHEIDIGHCGALPRSAWTGMARAQFARDAALAQLLQAQAARGAVLLAGNGHVRRDIGVPRWLAALPAQRVWAVGFVEEDGEPPAPGQFDAVVTTARAPRADPCEAFRSRPAPPDRRAGR